MTPDRKAEITHLFNLDPSSVYEMIEEFIESTERLGSLLED